MAIRTNLDTALSSKERPTSDRIWFVLLFILATVPLAFGCDGGGSSGSGSNSNPNRAHGVYRSVEFPTSNSLVFFSAFRGSGSELEWQDVQKIEDAVRPLRITATLTVTPGSIMYEERAVEQGTGRTITVRRSGQWIYSSLSRCIVADWSSMFITGSTFPRSPPYDILRPGVLLSGPQRDDLICFDDNWTSVAGRSIYDGPFSVRFFQID